jgi:hypothetical protein
MPAPDGVQPVSDTRISNSSIPGSITRAFHAYLHLRPHVQVSCSQQGVGVFPVSTGGWRLTLALCCIRHLCSAGVTVTTTTLVPVPVSPAPTAAPAPAARVPLKPASDVLCGALARAASQSTIHPLDTLKVGQRL